jgi:WXG100 family type VII secretion target
MAFQVTPEYLINAAASCERTADNIQGQLTSLKMYVMNMEDWWQGIAAGTFQGLMADYQQDANNLYQALTGIASVLRKNAANYVLGEQTNSTVIVNVQDGLPSPNLG